MAGHRATGPGHDHPDFRSRWPATSAGRRSLRTAPADLHRHPRTHTGSFSSSFWPPAVLTPPENLVPPRNVDGQRMPTTFASLRVLSFLRPVRTARTFAKRGGLGFGEGQDPCRLEPPPAAARPPLLPRSGDS